MSRSRNGLSFKFEHAPPPKQRDRYRVTFADKRRINDLRLTIAVWAADDEDPRELAEKLLSDAYKIDLRTIEYVDTLPEIDWR